MILRALCDYYDRLAAEPDSGIAPPGYSVQQVGFVVVITLEGRLHGVEGSAYDDKGKPSTRRLLLPGQSKPSGSGINPCFLWDNPTYLLGMTPEDRQPTWAAQRFEAFRNKHLALRDVIQDETFAAVCRFLEQWSPEQCRPEWATTAHHFGVFSVAGRPGYVHERPEIRRYWEQHTEPVAGDDSPDNVMHGECLVTGRRTPLARLHEPKIKGVLNAQSSGALLVSFNEEAYVSFAKEQSFNAPVSQEAAFKYATALNHLLAQRARRVIVGDATTVFWTQRPTAAETIWAPMLDSLGAEDDDKLAETRTLLQRIARGDAPPDVLGPPQTQYWVLGLSPNASRLSVRYWLTGTLKQLLAHLRRHLSDLDIIGLDRLRTPPVVRELLLETARDPKEIPPLLSGDLMRSILTGAAYPQALLLAVLRRLRADRTINTRRAALIKACLRRNFSKEVAVSLEPTRTDAPYLLGRLFATYEKIQKDLPGGEKLNRTIRESFLSSASASPVAVFPRLYKLSQHHLGQLRRDKPGLYNIRVRLLSEIHAGLQSFPSHLSLAEQGLFAIGYYHQMQDFYTPKADENASNTVSEETTHV